MFLRDRISTIYSIHIHMNFYDRLINGKREGIDFITWDQELHLNVFAELFKQLRASRAGFPWIEDEVNYLVELFEDGESIKGISKELCRSENAVIKKLQSKNLLPDDFDLNSSSNSNGMLEHYWSEHGRNS